MTPKEKAYQLVDNFFEFTQNLKWDSDNNEWIHNHDKAKKCALIAVDEIIKANPYEINKTDMDSTIDYWQEVKQEIEKL